jgi:O-methyltransferase
MLLSLKYCLTRIGAHMTRTQIYNLQTTVKYFEIGRKMRELGYRMTPTVETREQLFDLVGREVEDRQVLYLEFGVWEGRATRYWSKLLKNPESKLHGFDTFEGLPEAWDQIAAKGAHSANGNVPVIEDPRVRFFKGMFQETLPSYAPPEYEVLVLNFDADLYSSTIHVLEHFAPIIVPGTYLYFDEINVPQHELRAFAEFSSASGRSFALRGVTRSLMNVLFQCTA